MVPRARVMEGRHSLSSRGLATQASLELPSWLFLGGSFCTWLPSILDGSPQVTLPRSLCCWRRVQVQKGPPKERKPTLSFFPNSLPVLSSKSALLPGCPTSAGTLFSLLESLRWRDLSKYSQALATVRFGYCSEMKTLTTSESTIKREPFTLQILRYKMQNFHWLQKKIRMNIASRPSKAWLHMPVNSENMASLFGRISPCVCSSPVTA